MPDNGCLVVPGQGIGPGSLERGTTEEETVAMLAGFTSGSKARSSLREKP